MLLWAIHLGTCTEWSHLPDVETDDVLNSEFGGWGDFYSLHEISIRYLKLINLSVNPVIAGRRLSNMGPRRLTYYDEIKLVS